MYCLWEKVFHEIIFLHSNGICCCKLYIWQFQDTFFCGVLLSRVEHVLPFQMGNICHPASCQQSDYWALKRDVLTTLPLSNNQEEDLRSRYSLWRKGKTRSWTVDKNVPLCLILQADTTACGLLACDFVSWHCKPEVRDLDVLDLCSLLLSQVHWPQFIR